MSLIWSALADVKEKLMTKRRFLILVCVIFSQLTFSAMAFGQTLTTLLTFDGNNGSLPEYVSLVQGIDGNLYGTTLGGTGVNDNGTAFKITPQGTFTTLVSFESSVGGPAAGLALGIDGNFYGTGTNGYGSIFRITPQGSLTTLHTFNGGDGQWPYDALVQEIDGSFYGTTFKGGSYSAGSVFKVTSSGEFASLYSFNSPGGFNPWAGLALGLDGNLYGATAVGGTYGCGIIFRITPQGSLTTIHTFKCADGQKPQGTLLLGIDGKFYGTTSSGGPYGLGTVFKVTSTGVLTTLYAFAGSDGSIPVAGLTQGSDGNLYGTTSSGGAYGDGTVFSLNHNGTLTTLHSFDLYDDGALLEGGITQATNGLFYGVTHVGADLECGYLGCGSVFALDVGLKPFVSLLRNPAKAGQSFGILGQGLTGTIAVSVSGTAATYNVKSDTLILATVPPGATTGSVLVTTPSGTLTSNVPFRVVP